MKVSIILIAFLLTSIFSFSQFIIKGTVNKYSNSFLYLFKIKTTNQADLIDSTKVQRDSSFAISISDYDDGDLFILSNSANSGLAEFPNTSFMFSTDESKSIIIKANSGSELYNSKVVKASKQNKIISEKLLQNLAPYFNLLSKIEMETGLKDSLIPKIVVFQTTYTDSIKSLLTSSTMPNVLLTALYLLKKIDDGSNKTDFNSYYNTLHTQVPTTSLTIFLKTNVADQVKSINIEEILTTPVYNLIDKTRRNVASILKTDYVLLDLWASWCGPCRIANKIDVPKLISQTKSNSKFSIISISIDINKEKWAKAMVEDNITWASYTTENNISNQPLPKFLQGYGVPYYVLLTKDGKYLFSSSSIPLIKDWLKKL